MALADDIHKLGADTRAALVAVLDYYYQSRTVWKLIEDDVGTGRRFTSRNPAKGTVADQAEIVPRIEGYLDNYLKPATFQQVLTTFEAFVFDLLARWLTAHPGILLRKQVELGTVLDAPDKDAVLRGVIEKELNDVKYRRVADWFDYLRKLVGVPGPSADAAAELAEAKAGRDVLVHNKGVVNAVYAAKAGVKSRYAPGDILELPDPYFRDVTDRVEAVVADTAAAVAGRA
ncbi:MAG: hypothetical protein C0501_06300 [Isosphaera sp.]|nr:hypothetical protein [Isosphaera sp.]